MLLAPRYGAASLADVTPSLLAVLGLPGETDRLGLDCDGLRRVCLLVIDGLGAQLLSAHAAAAPFLCGLPSRVLTAGFPSTTATSLSSIGTGLPPGEHGLVGYLLGLPGQDRVMNTLQWTLHGPGPTVDLLREVVPERLQPLPTAFERAATAGVEVFRLAPSYQESSGLTRAALRGGEFRPTQSLGDLAAGAATALREGDRSLVYAYHGDLDLTGHVRGPGSEAWALELANVDRLAAAIADRLPPHSVLVVTGDHGMVEVTSPVDIDAAPALQEGVRLLGGEPRARYVYTRTGAADDVRTAWRETLGDGFAVLSRDEAVATGWFGPQVTSAVRPRIGDVIAVARSTGGLIRRHAEPRESSLVGHHGSLTSEEMLVPLFLLVAPR